MWDERSVGSKGLNAETNMSTIDALFKSMSVILYGSLSNGPYYPHALIQ